MVLLLAAFVTLTAALLEIEAENFCLLTEVTLCGNCDTPLSQRTGIRGYKAIHYHYENLVTIPESGDGGVVAYIMSRQWLPLINSKYHDSCSLNMK